MPDSVRGEKMILIAHRGNIDGPNPELENNPFYIDKAIEQGYNVEIDIRGSFYTKFYLGHDEPLYETDVNFIGQKKIWVHAKNIEALNELIKLEIHCFWHQDDDVTITSCGFMWTSPDTKLTEKSICVLPEINNQSITKCAGICSDYITNYRN